MPERDVSLSHEDELSQPPAEGGEQASEAAGSSTATGEVDQGRLAELDEQLERFQAQKRWSDVIKTILAKAELVPEPSDKIALFTEAGNLYLEKSSNQAEAIKCFQRVLEIDPHDVEAITQLKDLYEKRRDWERLIGLMETECELLDESDRPMRYLEIARLATERLRKPAICIAQWQKVLEHEPDNPEALSNLANLLERARDWEPLAKVLERQAEQIADSKDLAQALQKLGMIYADKLNDDEGAIRAFKRLLEIEPNDRRAQEQLKKRFVAQKAWDELEDFYATTEKWDELIRTVERAAESSSESDEEKVQLLFRAARLWDEKKEKPDRAARAYEKILQTDPQNVDAALALTPIYENAGDARKLVGVYEVRLEQLDDPEERLMLLREIGTLYEERLRKPDKAFESFLQALSIDPTREIVLEDVERVAERVKGWSRLIDAYKEAIGQVASPDDAIDLRLRLGRVLAQEKQVEEAIQQYQAVIEADPAKEDALHALESLYREASDFERLLEVYQKRQELETDPEVRRQLAYDTAKLWEEQLQRPDRAVEAYRNILAEYGDGEVDAYRALERLYESQQEWQELAEVLQRRIDLGPESDEELAALKFRLAQTQQLHLGDKTRALEEYREVVSLMPGHDEARKALEGLLSDAEVGGDVARILEPIYEERGEWKPLVEALEVLLSSTEDVFDRQELFGKIAETYLGRLDDPKGAFDVFSRALRESPESPDVLARLEALALEQDRFKDLVELLDELATATQDIPLARTLWMKAAQIQDTQLQDVEAAVRTYLQILEREPNDLEVIEEVEALYRRTERWRDLLGILRRRAELPSELDRKEELLGQMAQIHDELLQEPQEAIALYNEVLENNPTSTSALSALDRLYEGQQMWSELAENVSRQLELNEEPDEQIRLMLKLAELRETRMQAIEPAIEIYREVLDRDPANDAAMAALERLLEQSEYQAPIADVLEPIYRDSGEYQKLIGIHEIQLRNAASPDQRISLLHRIGELYEDALQDGPSAFKAFARALAEDPTGQDTQDQLDRLAGSTDAWKDLAEVYEQQVVGLDDAALAASLHVKAAEIREDRLGDTQGAIQHHRKVLELDPQSLESATALERLYQLTEQYEELAVIYLTKAGMLDAAEEQKEHLFKAASIYEELLERPVDAVRVYQRVLDVDPEELAALDKLIELFLKQERWEDLLDIYTRKADIVVDADEKKALYAEVGAVYERELQQTEKAIDTYQRILELDPDDMAAIGRLDALYQASGNWQELLAILEREADLAMDPSEATSYRYRIGELWEHKLGDPARAVDVYREILDAMGGEHEPTVQALEGMIAEGREALLAAQVLDPIYRQEGEWAKLVGALEVQVRHEEDPIRKVELLHQIAELDEVHLDRPREAFEAFGRALPHDRENPDTMAALERLAEQLSAWSEVAKLYDAQARALRDESPEAALDMALRLAQIYEAQLGDVDAAIERYRLVYEIDPGHVQAIEALDRLYEATQRWAELAEILPQEMEIAGTPDEVLDLQFRLGQVYQIHLGQVERAIDQYRDILSAAPEHAPTVEALESLFQQGVQPLAVGEILEPLYRMQESWDRLIGVQENLLRYQEDAGERVATMHRIAEIAEERALDAERAFVWMQRALFEDPLHDHTLAETERMAGMLGAWDQLADSCANVLEGSRDPAVVTTAGRRLARIYEEELDDVQRAEETYRFVLGVHDRDEEVLQALDRIYVEHGAHDALAAILRKRVDATDDEQERIDLAYRLGQTLDRDLGRADEAVRVYRWIIEELDPQHEDAIHSLQAIYTAQQDWRNLYDALQKELEVALGDSAQAEIVARMARIASDKMGQPERAVELWRRVLELVGEEREALNALGNIYARQENYTDLVDVLEREVTATDEDEARIRIFADLGRIWYEKLQRDRNALDAWERVLDIDPGNARALFAIADIHRASESYSELVDALQRIIEMGGATLEDAALEDVYMQLGALYAEKLQQPIDAVESYHKALEINPRNFAALDALDAIHRAEGQWEEVVQVEERRAEAVEDPQQKIQVLLNIARLWEEQLEERDRGTDAFNRILEIDPMHDHAFAQLQELHREAERYEDLVELYLTRLEASQDVDERVALLQRVADVYEKDLDDKNQAFDALLLAWQQDFTKDESAMALERIAGLTQRWNEVLTTANEALAELTEEDQELQTAICLKCARWYGREGHPEYAIPYLQQVLSFDSTNVPAMTQMADLYKQTGQWDVYTQVLSRLVEMTEDPQERADVYVRMGELAGEQFGEPDQAIEHFRRALDAVPTHLGALQASERIYRQQQRWDDLLDVLKRRLEATEDPDAALEVRLEIAGVYEDHLEQPEQAIQYYRQVLDAADDEPRALKGLERLYTRTERWPQLLEILQRELELETVERDRIDLLTRMAQMYEEEFVKPDKAAEALEQVIDIDPARADALEGLARLYRHMQRWDDLISTYERHVTAAPERADRIELYRKIGEVFAYELRETDRAIDAYLNILSLEEEDRAAIDSLARLYEKRGEHSEALDMMGKLAELITEPEERVDLHYRMGRVLDEQLGDRAAALDEYQKAVDLDAKHLPSLLAMRSIHRDAGDWHAAARTLEQAAEIDQSPRQAAALKVELGRLFEDRLDEHERAIETFEEALKVDPDSEDAALPLVDEYIRQERWADAEPLLQMLVRRAGARSTDEQQRLWYDLARCTDRLGQDAKAIKAYSQAFELDASHLPSLQGLAAAYYRTKEWDKAFKYYQMLLVHHREELGVPEITETFYRLGIVKREQGERRKALNMFDKALEEDEHHRPTLEALVDVYSEQNDFEQVIQLKKRLLEVADDDERFELLQQIGDLWSEKVDNPQKAIEAYSEASDMRPEDHRLLHKLLALYQQTSQWESAIEIIDRISDLDDRESVKAKYAYTVGVIYRDELKDPERAIERLNQALDMDPKGALKAFEAINKLLTQQKDWKQLERAFRKMLHRVTGQGNPELELNLWHNLGVIYRDRQRNFEAAAEAFKMASRVQPDNMQEHQILAELYASMPNRLDEAIAEHQHLLEHDPYRLQSYSQLYKLYFDARQYDRAWCIAATLTFLNQANQEQQQFFEQYRNRGPIRPASRITNEQWIKDVFHPQEDPVVGKLYESVAPAILRLRAQADRQLGLSKKELVQDFQNTTVTFARTFGFVAQVLGLPFTPRLFVSPGRQGGLAFATTQPPASVVGSALLSGMSPNDLMFVCARHLSYYRGEHFIRTMFHTKDELKMVLLAAMHLAGTDIGNPNVSQWAEQIRAHMQPADMELLNSVGKRFVEAGARTDIKRWMQGVELTGCRAGLLLCNDLGIASRMIQAEPPASPVDLPARDKVKELVLFSVSEPYFRLREALGIHIQVG